MRMVRSTVTLHIRLSLYPALDDLLVEQFWMLFAFSSEPNWENFLFLKLDTASVTSNLGFWPEWMAISFTWHTSWGFELHMYTSLAYHKQPPFKIYPAVLSHELARIAPEVYLSSGRWELLLLDIHSSTVSLSSIPNLHTTNTCMVVIFECSATIVTSFPARVSYNGLTCALKRMREWMPGWHLPQISKPLQTLRCHQGGAHSSLHVITSIPPSELLRRYSVQHDLAVIVT